MWFSLWVSKYYEFYILNIACTIWLGPLNLEWQMGRSLIFHMTLPNRVSHFILSSSNCHFSVSFYRIFHVTLPNASNMYFMCLLMCLRCLYGPKTTIQRSQTNLKDTRSGWLILQRLVIIIAKGWMRTEGTQSNVSKCECSRGQSYRTRSKQGHSMR